MTEGAAPVVDQAATLCVRCHLPFGGYRHEGWDPKGTICQWCWEQDVDALEDYRRSKEWAEFQQDLRECGG